MSTEKVKRTPDEKIAAINDKLEKLKEQKRKLESRVKAAERKERTKRLIQIGAEVEAYAGTITDLEALKEYLKQYGYAIRNTQKNQTENE